MITFKQINTSDQDLKLVQSNIQTAITQIQTSPFIGGNLLKDVALSSGGNNAVPHKLDHTPTVYVICGLSANSTVWTTSPATSTILNLSCSASCTVQLWVN